MRFSRTVSSLSLALAVTAAACTPQKAGSTGSTMPSGGGGSPVGTVTGAATGATCGCVSVAGEVSAAVLADVAKADLLYVRADFQGALALYAKAYATSKDAALLYAQGMVQWQLGANA